MNRLPVAERREQLITAALTVASRDGIEAATVRAVAAEAGVSLGVVHYCFQDKDELLRAMADAITEQNLAVAISTPPLGADVQSLLQVVIENLWRGIRENRGAQLLSYELTTTSLRHPELRGVAVAQYEGSNRAAVATLAYVERAAGVTWVVPREVIARTIVAVVDGFSLAWLVDGDDEAAIRGLRGFAKFLTSLAVPAGDVSVTPLPAPDTVDTAEPDVTSA